MFSVNGVIYDGMVAIHLMCSRIARNLTGRLRAVAVIDWSEDWSM